MIASRRQCVPVKVNDYKPALSLEVAVNC